MYRYILVGCMSVTVNQSAWWNIRTLESLSTPLEEAPDTKVVIKLEKRPVVPFHPQRPLLMLSGETLQWESSLMYQPVHVIFSKQNRQTALPGLMQGNAKMKFKLRIRCTESSVDVTILQKTVVKNSSNEWRVHWSKENIRWFCTKWNTARLINTYNTWLESYRPTNSFRAVTRDFITV